MMAIAKGDVYPDGPFRPGSAIQRGSVQFLSLGPATHRRRWARRSRARSGLPIDREWLSRSSARWAGTARAESPVQGLGKNDRTQA